MTADPRPARQDELRALLRVEGLSALLVTHLPNVRYLTGFTGSAAVVVVLAEQTVLFTDFRYEAQAPREVGDHARVEIVPSDTWSRVAALAGRVRGDAWGMEDESVTVATARRLTDAGVPGLRPAGGLVERLRVSKRPAEIAAIREAARLAGEAYEATLPSVAAGRTELDVAAVLEAELRRRGSEWHPFPTIVASGPRSALPHAGTSRRVIGRDELVLLDFGARVDGYCADLTRVVVAGRADDRQRTMHALVRDAQGQAIAGLRAGMTGREGDRLARRVIDERGFGDNFGHSLGHGLGLEVHEAPRLSSTNDDVLPAGSVVTVEPGVYFPGWGGVRLEDDVVVTDGGAEVLSDGRVELVELGG